MTGHEALGMVTINFAGHAHRATANFAKQFIFIISMVLTRSEIQNWALIQCSTQMLS